MNTPSHTILNLAILRRSQRPELTWPIIVGSLLPDAALFVFYGWARALAQLPDRVIWDEAYYQPFWQDVFAIGNSIPLALGGLGIALWKKRPAWAALFVSMLLHHAEDLPLHNEDAHRHFFPLSNLRIVSPVSYWDPDHFGTYVALVEMVLVLGASVWLFRRVRSRLGRGLLIANGLFYLLAYSFFYLRVLST